MDYFAALIAFIWGVGSLYLVAVKTNSVKSVFLRKPSIIIGDFFLIPVGVYLVFDDLLKIGSNWKDLFFSLSGFVAVLISVILTVISVARNHMTRIWWLPHILFYASMWFLAIFFLMSRFNLSWLLWWAVLLIVILHQSLGVSYPKKFPEIR